MRRGKKMLDDLDFLSFIKQELEEKKKLGFTIRN